jgi:DNA-binding transcriptional ArsR family regulator
MSVVVPAKQRESDQTARLDAMYGALASQQRREVLRVLAEAERNEHWAEEHFGARAEQLRGSSCCAGEVCACCFSEWLGLAPSTVSHHLHRLLDAGLVSARKDGLWVYYRLERAAVEAAGQSLREMVS